MTARTVLLYAVSVSLSCLASTTWGGVGVWTKGGPGGGPIAVLAVDPAMPATVYAGTPNNGVFKSIDGGAHWVAINTGLTELSITALAIDPAMPATVYLGVQSADNTEGMAPEGTPSRVFKTTDGGAHWTRRYRPPCMPGPSVATASSRAPTVETTGPRSIRVSLAPHSRGSPSIRAARARSTQRNRPIGTTLKNAGISPLRRGAPTSEESSRLAMRAVPGQRSTRASRASLSRPWR